MRLIPVAYFIFHSLARSLIHSFIHDMQLQRAVESTSKKGGRKEEISSFRILINIHITIVVLIICSMDRAKGKEIVSITIYDTY